MRHTSNWSLSESGIWQLHIGDPDHPKYLDIAESAPKTEALGTMPDADLSFDLNDIHIDQTPRGITLRIPLTPGEQLYGFGLQFKQINQRHKVFHLHVDHYGGQDNGRTHAPVPFYVSSSGYGVLIDTACYLSVYAGTANRADSPNPPQAKDRTTDRTWTAQPAADAVEVFAPANGVTLTIFGGPTPLDAVRRYNLFCGGGCLPPRWALGFWHRVPTPYTSEQAEAEVQAFIDRDFPLHVLGLEPGWHSKAYPCSYEWSPDRFSDPETFIARLKEKNVRVNLWENPYVSPEALIYDGLKPLSGSHTVWCGLVPDYAQAKARDILAKQHEQTHVAIGVSGYKIDECDGYDRWLWPDHATFPSGLTGEQMRQTYALQLQRLTTDIFRKNNTRTFGLVRGTNAGGQSFPYALYSDNYNHRDFITALCNSGISGLLWCPEARRASSSEEWVRRVQTACFSPIAQLNAWADGTKPWSFEDVAPLVQNVMKLRIRLSPYLYSAFARYHFDGTPPFHPMALETTARHTEEAGELDATKNPYALPKTNAISDQYMMGDSLLVAPFFTGETERQVVLPPGNWYDFYTGAYIGNGETITIQSNLETIPLLVKDGGIIPMLPESADLDINPAEHTLEIRHYGQSEGHFLLYNDDGKTFNYEQGDYAWQELYVEKSSEEFEGYCILNSGNAAYLCENADWHFMRP